MKHPVLLTGPCLTIRYLNYKGKTPAKDYVDSDGPNKAKLLAIARQLAETGRIRLNSRGHLLKGKHKKIMELKPGASRVMGFRHGSDFYLTNGAPKKKRKEQEKDYDRALTMRTWFLDNI